MAWTTLGESVTGTSHLARNVPCQDAFRFRTLGPASEWLVIVVADGAGSATHSATGATLACDEFVRQVEVMGPERLFTRDAVTELFATVRNAVLVEAKRLDVRPRELACTALLAVVGPASASFAQLGDGAIVHGQGNEYCVVFWPEPGEYANATDFLTDNSFEDRIRLQTVEDSISEFAAFTDGLQRLALDFTARTAFPGFFRALFRELRTATDPESLVEPLRAFLDSERVNERTDDDKTLVIAIRQL